ncbi:MAG TPA: carboxypeptidase-like regulatory domain-containing protein [Bryobacteraceae bacterium]|jgi:protocatechuate 3,4-dioxygenase beta subunit
MKPAILAILAATTLCAQGTTPVTGRITDSLHGQPVEGAAVSLTAGQFHSMRFTDEGGNYSFDEVPTGAGTVAVSAQGFLPFEKTNPDDLAISVTPDRIAHDFALMPVSSIVGRITSADDKRPPGITVMLYREDFTDGVRHWVAGGEREGAPWVGVSAIDTDGSFKVTNLSPGRYIVSAGPPTGETFSFVISRISGKFVGPENPAEGYVQTYYPGTIDFNAAIPVTLGPGETLTADLRVAKQPLFRVSGEIAMSSGDPFEGTVQVLSVGDSVRRRTFTGKTDTPGKFTVDGLPPGQYILASGSFPPQSIASATSSFAFRIRTFLLSFPFAITDHDVEGLRPTPLPPMRSTSIPGLFRTANGIPLPGNLSVLFAYPQPGGQTDSIPAAPNGEFWLTDAPGDYSVRPVVPSTYAVSEIRYGGGNYLNSLIPFDADTPDQTIAIILTDQPGSVSGSLIDNQQKPIAAKVILAPEPLPPNFDFRALHVASTDKNGSFSVNSLTPGRYKAAVLTGDDRKRDHDLAVLNDKFATADAFEITAGQSLTITPKP